MSTETDAADGIAWRPIDKMVFGGHEIRNSDYAAAAGEIHSKTGTLPPELIRKLSDLTTQSKNVVTGAPNAGATIAGLADRKAAKPAKLRDQVRRIQRDIQAFQKKHRLDRAVCVNLTSTEPNRSAPRTSRWPRSSGRSTKTTRRRPPSRSTRIKPAV